MPAHGKTSPPLAPLSLKGRGGRRKGTDGGLVGMGMGVALLLLGGCPGEPAEPPPPEPPPVEAGELVVHPALFTREDEPLRLLSDGDPLDLWNATQGGHVALVGAQLEGVQGDTVELRARLIDKESGVLVAEEARTVVVRPVPGDPSRKQSDIRTRSQVTHLPLCPNYEPIPMVDHEYFLEVRATELYVVPPRKGIARIRVKPSCGDLAADPAICRCECEANYVLGKCK